MTDKITDLKDLIKIGSITGSEMAFSEILRLIEEGISLETLKIQMLVNIQECKKILSEYEY